MKNSARNSSCPASPRNLRCVSFTVEKSRFDKPGPLRKLRDVLPINPSGCKLNAQGSNQCAVVRVGVPGRIVVPQPAEVPWVMLEELRVGSTFGRAAEVVDNDNVRFVFSVGSNGYPVCHDKIPLTHQPFASTLKKWPDEIPGKW